MEAERLQGHPSVEEMVASNVKLVHFCCRPYMVRGKRYGQDYDDLVQVAMVGLVRAAQRFDPGLGLRFSTYAVPVIRGELGHLFVGLTRKKRGGGIVPLRLDAPLGEDGATYADVTPSGPDDHTQVQVEELLRRLSDRDRDIVEMRMAGHLLAEIAAKHDLSQEGVRLALQRAAGQYRKLYRIPIENGKTDEWQIKGRQGGMIDWEAVKEEIEQGEPLDTIACRFGYKSARGLKIALKSYERSIGKAHAEPSVATSMLRPLGYVGKHATYMFAEGGVKMDGLTEVAERLSDGDQLRAFAAELIEVAKKWEEGSGA